MTFLTKRKLLLFYYYLKKVCLVPNYMPCSEKKFKLKRDILKRNFGYKRQDFQRQNAKSTKTFLGGAL